MPVADWLIYCDLQRKPNYPSRLLNSQRSAYGMNVIHNIKMLNLFVTMTNTSGEVQ